MITPIFWSNYGSLLLGDLQGAENTNEVLSHPSHLSSSGKENLLFLPLTVAQLTPSKWLLDK